MNVDKFRSLFGETFARNGPAVVVRAPGRVNLIGDHTDYNDGFVLPATLNRAVYVGVSPREDGVVRLYSNNFDEHLEYEISARPETADSSWIQYVTGAIEELRARASSRGGVERGFDMLIYGDVPLGAGLSSSAALTVAVVFGLETLFELDLDVVDSIRLSRLVEHRYAGVECGIMDPFASRLGRRDHALFLDCRSLEYEHVPLPLAAAGLALVLVDSGVSRELAGSMYGERRRECDQVVAAFRRADRSITSLRDVGDALMETGAAGTAKPAPVGGGAVDIDAESDVDGGVLLRRARHVIEENARVLRARDALQAARYAEFGELMNESHVSLRDLYEVSIPEIDTLVAEAQAVEGVLGSRMTGGGFGGCTVNLVRLDAVDRLRSHLESAYSSAHGRRPAVFAVEENFETGVLDGGK